MAMTTKKVEKKNLKNYEYSRRWNVVKDVCHNLMSMFALKNKRDAIKLITPNLAKQPLASIRPLCTHR